MRQIAEEIADQKIAAIIPQIQVAALQQARDDLLRAFAVDVETIVHVAFQNGETIFRDKKTQRVIADNIMREIRKRLDRFTIWKKEQQTKTVCCSFFMCRENICFREHFFLLAAPLKLGSFTAVSVQ